MDDGLLTAVLEQLDERPLSSQLAESLLLAALEDDNALERVREGADVARPEPAGRASGQPIPGAYLQSLTVTGFRGIGPETTLGFSPGPGLTVVSGRNGSGKSSFAEALELLLTGTIKRWDDRSSVWQDNWRCLHADRTEVSATLLVEGTSGPTTLFREWTADAQKVTEGVATMQLTGKPKVPIATLGWDRALHEHRPLLSHAELETLLARPKDLYDQLNSILGLDALDDASQRLTRAKREADASAAAAKNQLAVLQAALDAVDDERATRASQLLQAKKTDLDSLRSLATGTTTGEPEGLARLEQLTRLRAVDIATVTTATRTLRAAVTALEDAQRSAAGDAATTAELLEAALVHAAGHPAEQTCPVCGTPGIIDEDWCTRTEREADRLREGAQAVRDATGQLRAAEARARNLVAPVPPWLSGISDPDVSPLITLWQQWAELPAGSSGNDLLHLADHLEQAAAPLAETVEAVRDAATEEYERRQDRWAPLAGQLAQWCDTAESSAEAKALASDLKAASTWLKVANDRIRNDRLRPFANQSVAVWRQLRQASNVELTELRLSGAANRSHVDFAVTVDGQTASGLGVMSQGEVNALALSVFLPRATMAGSPFRFLVIDDPVQAMDPSKVDGLARVLAAVAVDRQVVVFTHDDRLAEAVRRLELGGRLLQVARKSDSVVEVHPVSDPCTRLLDDAGALARGDRVPPDAAALVVAGLCRTAFESALNDIIRKKQLARGSSHAEVEEAIITAPALMTRTALAIFGDSQQGGDVFPWCNKKIGIWAGDALRTLKEETHSGARDPGQLVGVTRDLVERFRQALG